MKLSTWNVNGLRARWEEVLAFMEREHPEVLCLQEIRCRAEQVPEPLRGRSDYFAFWHGLKGYSGVALLVRRDAVDGEPHFHHPAFDHESRIVVAEFGDLVLASLYAPNGGKDYPAKIRFLEALTSWVGDLHTAGRRVVICGDVNIAREERDVHPSLRKPKQIGQTPEERALFARLLDTGLVDLGRMFAPHDDWLFTWWAPWARMRERNMGWRLDYVLVSEPLAMVARACHAERRFGTSDHGPVTAVLDFELPSIRERELGLGWHETPRQLAFNLRAERRGVVRASEAAWWRRRAASPLPARGSLVR